MPQHFDIPTSGEGLDFAFLPPEGSSSFLSGYNGVDADCSVSGSLKILSRTKIEDVTNIRIRLSVCLGGIHDHRVGKGSRQIPVEDGTPTTSVLFDESVVPISGNLLVGPGQAVLLPFSFKLPFGLPASYDCASRHWSQSFCRYRIEAAVKSVGDKAFPKLDIPIPSYDPETVRLLLKPPVPSTVKCTASRYDLDWSVTIPRTVVSPGETISVLINIEPNDESKGPRVSEVIVELIEHCEALDRPPTAFNKYASDDYIVTKVVEKGSSLTSSSPSDKISTLSCSITVPPQVPRITKSKVAVVPQTNVDGIWSSIRIRHAVRVSLRRSKILGFTGSGTSDGDQVDVPVVIASCDRAAAIQLDSQNPTAVGIDVLPTYFDK